MIQKIHFINKNIICSFNKSVYLTSNQFIQLIKKYSDIDKIGHSGTLDPSASGVLIVCTNLKTRNLNYLLAQNKRYLVFCIFGLLSDTADIFGKIKYFSLYKFNLEKNKIKTFLLNLKKEFPQNPPMYSSIKHNGYRLYKYSRLEICVNVKHQTVRIYKIFLVKIIGNILILDVKCSKGTYIREIINNLSVMFNFPISVYKIIRLENANYSILDSVNIF